MKKESEKSSDRHIRIRDIDMLSQIDKVMELPEYKSFNKVICEALSYGLPMLIENLFCEKEEVKQEEKISENQDDLGEFYAAIVKLLREIVLNAIINKSMLSSLFNAKKMECDGFSVPSDEFEQGIFSDTPEYLEEYEFEGIKGLRK